MSTELFLVLCKKSGLENSDLDMMTIGMCLDYVDEYIESKKLPQEHVREADQADFDHF